MKKIILLGIILLNLSCENNSKEEIIIFYAKGVSTINVIDCENLEEINSLKKLEVKSKKIINKFKKIVDDKNKIPSEDVSHVDIRYKIIYKNDTVCLGKFSELIYKGEKFDQYPGFAKIIYDYTDKNDSLGIYVNEDFKDFQKYLDTQLYND